MPAALAPALKGQRTGARPPALVISLDFELHWGVFDRVVLNRAERRRLLVAREVVLRILNLFQEREVHATWAIVGMLFAASRDEIESFRPSCEPGYADQRLNPYRQAVGRSEEEDPFHFAPSLIRAIADTRGQEIASHSYSHYCSLERGQRIDEFAADLQSAVAIAARYGHTLESYVFPRNEVNPSYLPVLARYGFHTYRATEQTGMKHPGPFAAQRRPHRRLGRLLDSYVNLCGAEAAEWPAGDAPVAIPASRYLRPWRPPLRWLQPLLVERIRGQMRAACQQGKIFHLWWHPEDFAHHPEESLRMLRQVLSDFEEMQTEYGMISLTMCETLDYTTSKIGDLACAAW